MFDLVLNTPLGSSKYPSRYFSVDFDSCRLFFDMLEKHFQIRQKKLLIKTLHNFNDFFLPV